MHHCSNFWYSFDENLTWSLLEILALVILLPESYIAQLPLKFLEANPGLIQSKTSSRANHGRAEQDVFKNVCLNATHFSSLLHWYHFVSCFSVLVRENGFWEAESYCVKSDVNHAGHSSGSSWDGQCKSNECSDWILINWSNAHYRQPLTWAKTTQSRLFMVFSSHNVVFTLPHNPLSEYLWIISLTYSIE